MHPNTQGILESSLYVADVAHSARFYEKIFGFPVISDFGERGCAIRAGDREVLLLFKKGASRDIASPHDGDGELHLAFAIAAADLTRWASVAGRERNRRGRITDLGTRWSQPLFQRSRPPSHRDCHAGSVVDLLTSQNREPPRPLTQRYGTCAGAYRVKAKSREAFAWHGKQVPSAAALPGFPSAPKCPNPQPPVS